MFGIGGWVVTHGTCVRRQIAKRLPVNGSYLAGRRSYDRIAVLDRRVSALTYIFFRLTDFDRFDSPDTVR